MLRFEGDKRLIPDPATCWAKLTDPGFLTRCISNIEAVVQSQPDQARFKLRPGVSFVRGTLEVTVKIDQIEPARSARYSIRSQGIGSSSDVEALLTLTPAESGSRVHWVAEIKSLGGLLKAIPQGLIKASAQKVIGDILAEVETKLNALPPSASGE
jgi:carbon monoxide dehydrogenase subunit G